MKIIIVDDSITMRRVLKNELFELGIGFTKNNIYTAGDGKEALSLIKENKFDLILTDWNMPKMNGLELVKEIRKIDDYCLVPIVMVTTIACKGEVIKALKSGINNYIVKPIDKDLVKQKLLKLLQQRLTLKELE